MENGASQYIKRLSLKQLEADGWHKRDIVLDESKKGKTDTLGKLLNHLRNAAAHQRISVISDHSDIEKIEITFEDALLKKLPIDWCACINASELKEFCDKFTNKLEELVG